MYIRCAAHVSVQVIKKLLTMKLDIGHQLSVCHSVSLSLWSVCLFICLCLSVCLIACVCQYLTVSKCQCKMSAKEHKIKISQLPEAAAASDMFSFITSPTKTNFDLATSL